MVIPVASSGISATLLHNATMVKQHNQLLNYYYSDNPVCNIKKGTMNSKLF